MEPTMEAEHADMQTIENRIGGMETKLDTLNDNVLTLKGQMMPRAEIEAADARRVSLERFESEMSGVRDRLGKVESGPQRLLGWISLFVSATIGCLSLLIGGAVGVVSLLALAATVLIALIPHLR